MTIARKEIVPENESGIYHCTSRCVRRAFLCGFDRLTGKDFSHRRDWIKSRLQELAQDFGVKVFGYAVMSNHVHVILETQVEETSACSQEDVALRWLRIFPKRRDQQGNACNPSNLLGHPINNLTSRQKYIQYAQSAISPNTLKEPNP